MSNLKVLKAFHGDIKVKEKYLNRVRAHRAADEIIKGYYWENGKGCAVGCTVHSGSHRVYERELGIPMALARLEDALFELLPNAPAMAWPEKFLEAIQEGADLGTVADRFVAWLLTEPDGVLQFVENDAIKTAIRDVGRVFGRRSKGESIAIEEWVKVRNAAYEARRNADPDVAWTSTADDTYAACATKAVDACVAGSNAAYASSYAASYAASAAWVAYEDRAATDARAADACALNMADKLIELLREVRA